MVDRLERLTDLVLVLLRDGRPKPLREIAAEVPGYPAEGEARRQAFERDKRTLRDGGVDVSAVPIEGKEQVGYVIRPEDFYLPDLDLAPDEQAALNLAVAGVHLGDPSGRDALWRLGLPASAGVQPFADLTALPALPVLYDAVRRRASVTFDYRGDTRHVAPALLRFRGGWWYLVGFDLDKEASRTFRVDRMDGAPSVGPDDSAVMPDDFDPTAALPEEPWRMGEEEAVRVDVLVDAGLAPLVVAEVGASTVHEQRPDGAVVVRLEVTNIGALRSWVLELGEHAEVLAPDHVRAAMVSWLEAIARDTTAKAGH
jgi:predicted DNA-binding transcriptional regulator YafY